MLRSHSRKPWLPAALAFALAPAVGCVDDASRADLEGADPGGDGGGEKPRAPTADWEGNLPPPEPPPFPLCEQTSTTYQAYFSDTYEMNCANCHDRFGAGVVTAAIPALPGRESADFESFARVVREGTDRGMPPFDETWVTDADLEEIWDALVAIPDPADRAAAAETRPRPDLRVEMDQPTIDLAYEEGLGLWRTAGSRGECAGCHGPEGTDLARLGYTNAQILRRSIGQALGGEDSQKLVRFIHAVRARRGMTEFCRPEARIMQPGGIVLQGRDPVDRDLALVEGMKERGLNYFDDYVRTRDEARDMAYSLLSTGLLNIPVAFPFPRWTEDAHNGDPEHRRVSEWIPEYPRDPKPEFRERWYALQDEYIDEPSAENLWKLYDHVDDWTTPEAGLGDLEPAWFTNYNRVKFLLVLQAQHMFRDYEGVIPDMVPNAYDRAVYLDKGLNEPLHHLIARRGPSQWWFVQDGVAKGTNSIVPGLTDLAPFARSKTKFEDDLDFFKRDLALSAHTNMWIAFSLDPSFQRIDRAGHFIREYFFSNFQNSHETREELHMHSALQKTFDTFGRAIGRDPSMGAANGAWSFGAVFAHPGYVGDGTGESDDSRFRDHARYIHILRANRVLTVMFLAAEELETGVCSKAHVTHNELWDLHRVLLSSLPEDMHGVVDQLAAQISEGIDACAIGR